MMKGVKIQSKGAVAELRRLGADLPDLLGDFHKDVGELELKGAQERYAKNLDPAPAIPRTGRLGRTFKLGKHDEKGVEVHFGDASTPYAAWWSFGGRNGAGGYRRRIKAGRDMFAAWPAKVRKQAREAAEKHLDKWAR